MERRLTSWGWVTLRVTLLLAFAASLNGCSLPIVRGSSVRTKTLELVVDEHANDDSPVQVEVVAVRDEALLKILLATPAAKWFPARLQFSNDYPTGYESYFYEMVPGQRLVVANAVPGRLRGTKALLLFANYRSPGDHRVRLDAFNRVTVSFMPTGFTLAGTR